MAEAVMHDRTSAKQAGLLPVTTATCMNCHPKTFDAAGAMKKIAHPSKPPAAVNGAVEAQYKNPLNMALRPGGKELWIACESADAVIIVDTATEQKIDEIPVGGMPIDVAFTPDGAPGSTSATGMTTPCR